MTGVRHGRAVRALPVLLVVLLAVGLLGADRTGTAPVVDPHPATAGTLVLVAAPSDADAVVNVSPMRHLPVRTPRLGLVGLGLLVAAASLALRRDRRRSARLVAMPSLADGVAVRPGRAPPRVAVDAVHARGATGR